MTILRGDVYWVDWSPGRGSEQAGIRPGLVIQNDVGNRVSPTTIVAALTTQFDRVYPFMVRLDPTDSGLPRPGVADLGQIVTITHDRLLPPRGEQTVRPIGHIDYPKMEQVDLALRVSLAL